MPWRQGKFLVGQGIKEEKILKQGLGYSPHAHLVLYLETHNQKFVTCKSKNCK
jgi:hypothetical protein